MTHNYLTMGVNDMIPIVIKHSLIYMIYIGLYILSTNIHDIYRPIYTVY